MTIKICIGCSARYEGNGHYCGNCNYDLHRGNKIPRDLFPTKDFIDVLLSEKALLAAELKQKKDNENQIDSYLKS